MGMRLHTPRLKVTPFVERGECEDGGENIEKCVVAGDCYKDH